MLKGYVEVPHLTDAEENRYSALFKDVDVGTGWRSRVIFETQGPIDLSYLSIGKCELGLGRNVLVGDGFSFVMSAFSFALVSIIGILEFRCSFLPFISLAFSPICLVVGILVFVGHIGLPAGTTFSERFEATSLVTPLFAS